MGAAIVLAGTGAALAILLSSGDPSSSTTVLVDSTGSTAVGSTADPPAAGGVEAGRYVQAGSFRTTTYAEVERDRLRAAGIEAEVVSSDGAGELYPGFRVLLVGPLEAKAEEKAVLRALHRNGVPSAYARPLSPAKEIQASEAAGEWSGVLERSSDERPGLTESLSVTLEVEPDGRSGILDVPAEACTEPVDLFEAGSTILTYTQDLDCVSGGYLRIRPAEGELMVSMLPLDSDVLVTGSLTPR